MGGCDDTSGSGASSSGNMGGAPRRSHMNRRDLSIFLGRSNPCRFLKHYKLAWAANTKDMDGDFVCLLPLSLDRAASEGSTLR